jgi:hypothetical protein
MSQSGFWGRDDPSLELSFDTGGPEKERSDTAESVLTLGTLESASYALDAAKRVFNRLG